MSLRNNLNSLKKVKSKKTKKVAPVGFDPTTFRLRVRRATVAPRGWLMNVFKTFYISLMIDVVA